MKIGFIYFPFVRPTTGASAHGYYLAKELVKLGHTLFATDHPGAEGIVGIVRNRRGFLRVALSSDVLYIRPSNRRSLQEAATMLRFTRRNLPVIWELNSPIEELLAFSTPDNHQQILKQIAVGKKRLQFFARHVDAAVAVSETMGHYARNVLGINNTIIVPNGADIAATSNTTSTFLRNLGQYFRVLWAGASRYPWQGIEQILEAAAILRSQAPDILFVLINANTIHNESIPDNVIVLPGTSLAGVMNYAMDADCLLAIYNDYSWCPYGFYNSPLKLFQFMATGKPVIATALGQNTEVITNEKDGLLVPPNAQMLAEAISKLRNNRNYGQKMGKAGREKICRHYTWSHTAAKVEKLITAVTTKRERISGNCLRR